MQHGGVTSSDSLSEDELLALDVALADLQGTVEMLRRKVASAVIALRQSPENAGEFGAQCGKVVRADRIDLTDDGLQQPSR